MDGGGDFSVLQCVHCVAVWCRAVQCLTGCCRMLQCGVVVHTSYTAPPIHNVCIRMLSSTVAQVHSFNDTTPEE